MCRCRGAQGCAGAANCQVAVSLSLATVAGSVPLAYRLYLPQIWAEDPQRREVAGVPKAIEFRTKGELTREQVEAALVADVPRGVVLADAAYGDEAAFRQGLSACDLDYVLAVRSATGVWWGQHQPAPTRPSTRRRPRTRLARDAQHQPISVLELARSLPAKSFRTVAWREGTRRALSSRFTRVRVRAAQGHRARPEEWLLIEWPVAQAAPTHYWLSTLPEPLPFKH